MLAIILASPAVYTLVFNLFMLAEFSGGFCFCHNYKRGMENNLMGMVDAAEDGG
jgi:hypothetical protein